MVDKRSTGQKPDPILSLRDDIINAPITVGLHRARVFTDVWQDNEGAPWIVKKGLALRRYLETVPLYVRPHDRIAGAISEAPGAMPVFVELGIGENSIYVGEYPNRRGYLNDPVPPEILDYWEHRNLWGQFRAYARTVKGIKMERTEVTGYKFLSNQGHLSPDYEELLAVGLDGILTRIEARRSQTIDPSQLEFLTAASHALLGLSAWAERYAAFLADEARGCDDPTRQADLQVMSENCAHVAHHAPRTFWQAMQLIWLAQQAIHIEGHGYSCTPDRVDQRLYPFYRADREAGRLTHDEALTLCENFILKQRDNTVWGIEHNLTQGLVLSGSTPEGVDQTNELSWLFVKAAGRVSVPEPLVWVRWHPNIDQNFFDVCLETLAGSTCFPLMMNDLAVPAMLQALGVSRQDSFRYVPVGCNEIGIPGKAYFNPVAHVNYLEAVTHAMTGGRGYEGDRIPPIETPEPEELTTFDALLDAVEATLAHQIEASYAWGVGLLEAQMRWGQTPLTSCFFEGCIEDGHDLTQGTTYNLLSCGGVFFANMVDSLAAIREVVYEKEEATLTEVAEACRSNFEGYERLRQQLLNAPKHGNDDPRLDDLIERVQRMRDRPMKAICRDPRDGTPCGNSHVTRSAAVRVGSRWPATPDGRLAGTPLASSVAASCGVEERGPTALLNSILKLDPVQSWQSGYNVNIRFHRNVLADPDNREKARAMLNTYFQRGGQEMQINCADTAMLRDAQKHPERYRDLVVRVAGFSEYFISLSEAMQEDIIARVEHAL